MPFSTGKHHIWWHRSEYMHGGFFCVSGSICVFKQDLILYHSDVPLVTAEFVLLVYSLPVLSLPAGAALDTDSHQ